MANAPNINTCDFPATLEELVADAEKHPDMYEHLQIILKRDNNNQSLGFSQEYLLVSSIGFAVHQLLDIGYSNGLIQLKFKERTTDEIVFASLDVNDRNPKFFLVRWNDIKQMVYAENTYNNNIDDILELNE